MSEMTATKIRKSTTRRASKPAAERQDVYEIVTAKVVEALQNGTVPWQQPWTSTGAYRSLSSKKPYRGINVWLLAIAQLEGGYTSPWWGTYDKINELGGQIRKGEKHTKVTLWKRCTTKVDSETKPGEKVVKPYMLLRYYMVFNAEQADWADGKAPTVETDVRTAAERDDAAEQIVHEYTADGGPSLSYGGDRAYYVPALDAITVPPVQSFTETGEFYSTVFHEIGHSTGHESRLARKGATEYSHFGSEKYSKEELVAEMTAALLLGVAGLDTDSTVENSGAYLRGWISRLTEDPKLVVHAAAQAQHAADLVLGVEYADAPAADTATTDDAATPVAA